MDECWLYYDGHFEHDDKSGSGVLVLSNGEEFIGNFQRDMAEGYGEFTKINGEVQKGVWKQNKLVSIIE